MNLSLKTTIASEPDNTHTTTDSISTFTIARMENPWTLSSGRILISLPEFEWERKFINPNGWTPEKTPDTCY